MFDARLKYSLIGVAVVALGIVGIYGSFMQHHAALSEQQPPVYSTIPATIAPPPPLIPPYPYPPVPQPVAEPDIYAAVRTAMVATGVDEDKVDGPAADLSAAIEQSIRKPVDELWFYGKIAAASLVPLWVVALVGWKRHQKPPVELSHFEWIVRQANLVALDRDYDAPASLVRRR
jgi:hypothetical protein